MRAQRRQLLPFAALSASYFAHIGFFNPYLPLWLHDQGLSLLTISLLSSLQSATRLFAPYGWGWLSDHTGERVRLLRFGASAALVISCGLWVDWGVGWLATVLALMFMHTSAMMPMSEAAMAHLVSRAGSFDAGRYGRVRLWGSLGFLVTVFAAGAWFERFGMHDFPSWTVITLLAVVASAWALPDLREQVAAHEKRQPVWPVLRRPVVRWFFTSLFFHVLAHMMIYIFFSLYLNSLGYSKTMIGVLWAVSVLVEVAFFFTQSRWLPLLSPPAWLVLCAGVMVLRMGMTAMGAQLLWLLMLAQMLHALTFAAHHSMCIASLSEYFPGNLRGRGQALYTVLAYGVPGVVAGLLGGALSERFGLSSVFWLALASSAVATACAWQVQKKAVLQQALQPRHS